MPTNDPLNKSELRFWIPIVISIVSVVVSWGALATRISLVEQKQGDILAGITDIKDSLKDHLATNMADHNDLIALKAMLGLK